MPYRAMFFTLITVSIALIAVMMWVSAVAPLLAHSPDAPITATHPAGTDPATMPAQSLRLLFKATLILSFVLVCLLLLLGFAATFREWVKVRTSQRPPVGKKTQYVDAWKLAGQRLEAPPNDPGEKEDA